MMVDESGLRGIDAAVHRLVFGRSVQTEASGLHHAGPGWGTPVPPYSTDIRAAWEIVELICRGELTMATGDPDDGCSQLTFHLYPTARGWVCRFWSADSEFVGSSEPQQRTAPLAICLAALAAVNNRDAFVPKSVG